MIRDDVGVLWGNNAKIDEKSDQEHERSPRLPPSPAAEPTRVSGHQRPGCSEISGRVECGGRIVF